MSLPRRRSCFLCCASLHPPYIKCTECVYSLLCSDERLTPNCAGNTSIEVTTTAFVDDYINSKKATTTTTAVVVAADQEEDPSHSDDLESFKPFHGYVKDGTMENALICPICFSTGRSNAVHLPSHQYEVIRDDFPVIPGSTWTGKEELALLDAIESCGLGSWQDVAKYVPCRTARECEKHYFKTFINGGIPDFPECREPPDEYSCFAPYKNTVCSLPPRPSISSSAYNDISGYMAARGEFTTDYDNHAELIVKDIEFVSQEEEGFGSWYEDVKLAMVEIYRYRVYERERRKRIVRDYGLMDIRGSALYFVGLTKRISQTTVETLRRCMRLVDAEEFLKYVESLKSEVRLKQQITRLHEYRTDGITKLHHIRVFEKLKSRRLETKRKRTSLVNCINLLQDQETWKRYKLNNSVADKIASGGALPHPALSRKKAGPLEIAGLPGYERLAADEKELCALARLVPSAFIDFKTILINDCKKEGFLRLAKARTLIKIDVNKTRKIFDFLVEKEMINKEPLT